MELFETGWARAPGAQEVTGFTVKVCIPDPAGGVMDAFLIINTVLISMYHVIVCP